MMDNLLFISLILSLTVSELIYAKCSYFPLIDAEVAFNECQDVKFQSSISKIDWFPNVPPTYIQEQGESISGTLIVGKILKSRFEERSRKFKIPRTWKVGETTMLFLQDEAKNICPNIFPGKIKVKSSGRCCDVLPYRGECIIPDTIHVVNKIDSK